ncbi:MAG: SDR family NAD(P)-dependent oxidoreductase [Hymenobacter sp.]
MPTAIVTGASRGLGLALAQCPRRAGVEPGARRPGRRRSSCRRPRNRPVDRPQAVAVHAILGDVADDRHRRDLIEAARRLGGPDLLVNNASLLGPSPQPRLADYPLGALRGGATRPT